MLATLSCCGLIEIEIDKLWKCDTRHYCTAVGQNFVASGTECVNGRPQPQKSIV